MTSLVLEARALTIAYSDSAGRRVRIADHLSFKLPTSSSLCLVGRSGSGKTSILRVLAGLAAPNTGDVFWWDSKLSALKEEQVREVRRSRIGYADQASFLVPDLTTLENLMLPAIPRARSERFKLERRGKDLLERLGLLQRQGALPRTLSGGERQRVALARALLTCPELIIVDEPTASLDLYWAGVVVDLLKECQTAGATIVTASHDPAVVSASDYGIRVENLVQDESVPSAVSTN